MKNFRNICTNLLILALAALTVIQTWQLWFNASSNHNFFYMFGGREPAYQNNGSGVSFASPYRIIVSASSQTVKIMYGGLSGSAAKQNCDQVISSLLQNGEFVSQKQTDWNEILKNRCLIYDYAFTMPADIFVRCFNQRGTLLISQVESFDQLVFIPARSAAESVRILLVNADSGICSEFRVNEKSAVNEAMTVAISEAAVSGGIDYLYSAYGLNLFAANTYIPQFSDDGYDYNPVSVKNPYAQSGQAAIYTVEKEVDMFFLAPLAKSSSTEAGVYTYSDSTTRVKYYENNVLEYQNFKNLRTTEKKSDPNLLADYAAATAFIGRDSNIKNEYYLEGYSEEDGRHIFRFNYVLGNFKIVIPDVMRSEHDLGIDCAIEITVDRENVIRYKKLAYNFVLDTEIIETANLGFESFINGVFEPYFGAAEDSGLIQNIDISYKLEKSSMIYLSWFMQINEHNYVSPVKTR